jgi:hypothetical protein
MASTFRFTTSPRGRSPEGIGEAFPDLKPDSPSTLVFGTDVSHSNRQVEFRFSTARRADNPFSASDLRRLSAFHWAGAGGKDDLVRGSSCGGHDPPSGHQIENPFH